MLAPQGPPSENPRAAKFNGSFLVLNLEANAVGVGNAGEFRPVPLRANAAGASNGNAAGWFDFQPAFDSVPAKNNADSVAESSGNGDASTKNAPSRALATRDVEKKERAWRMEPRKPAGQKKRNTGRRTASKRKARDEEVAPEEMPPANGVGSDEASASGWSPPQYLINLLGFFGWKVQLRSGSVGFVYVSPQGITYSSLPKIFEIFLHGNWKSDLSQHFTSNGFMIDGVAVQERGGPSRGNARMKKGCKEKNVEVAGAREPLAARGVGRRTRSAAKRIASEEALKDKLGVHVGAECMMKEAPEDEVGFHNALQSIAHHASDETEEICEDVNPRIPFSRKSRHVRRSSRLNQKHASNKSQLDLETNTSCSDSPDSPNLEKDENEEITPSSDSEFDVSDASDMSSEASITSSDDEYKVPSTRMKRKLSKVRKKSRNTMGSKKRGITTGDSLFCSTGTDLSHANSLIFGAVSEGDPLIPTKQTSTDEKINDREDVVLSAPMLNKEEAETASPSSDPFSNLKAEDFSTSGIKSGSTRGVTRSPEQTNEKSSLNCSVEMEATVQGDSYQNDNEGILFENRNAEMLVTYNEKTLGRKPKNLQLFRTRRWKGDARNELSNTTSSQVECALEDPIFGKSSSSRKKRKSASCINAKGRKKRRSGGCGLMVNKGKGICEDDASKSKATVLSWLIDAGFLTENEKVFHKLKADRKRRLGGFVTRGGIRCNCCKDVITLSKFDAHAGSATHQPLSDICCSSGESLIYCLTTAWNKLWAQKREKAQRVGDKELDSSDDTCGICADGGCLICCDNCSSTFHQDCLLLEAIPADSWYCPHCTCRFCKVKGHGSERDATPTNLYTCNQCYCKYHLDCAVKKCLKETIGQPASFCSKSCQKVNMELSAMIGVTRSLPDGFSWTLLKRCDDDGFASAIECNIKLSVAVSVLKECFAPLVDQRTGLDMLSQAVYNCGSQFKRLSYEGFYTAILEKDEEIVSVATLRLHGTRLAEMPFIGTRPVYQRRGMCRRLLEAILDMLSSLHVEKLIIPSIPELLQTWISSFGFQPLEEHIKNEIRSLSLVVFAETTLLQKSITIIAHEDGGDECSANLEISDNQRCADDWIQTLLSADKYVQSWSGLCYASETRNHMDNSAVIKHIKHTELDEESPNLQMSSSTGVSTATSDMETRGRPLKNSESPLSVTPPARVIAEPCLVERSLKNSECPLSVTPPARVVAEPCVVERSLKNSECPLPGTLPARAVVESCLVERSLKNLESPLSATLPARVVVEPCLVERSLKNLESPLSGTLPARVVAGPCLVGISLKNSESPLSGTLPARVVAEPCLDDRSGCPGPKSSLSLPSYDRPFSATNMGTPSWLEPQAARKGSNDRNVLGFSAFARRQLIFGRTSETMACEGDP